MADDFNLTINDKLTFSEPHEPSIDGNPFPEIIASTYIDTRGKMQDCILLIVSGVHMKVAIMISIYVCLLISVYVFLGEHNGLVDMMSNLEARGLLATGEYIVIHTDLATFDTNHNPLKYFQRK